MKSRGSYAQTAEQCARSVHNLNEMHQRKMTAQSDQKCSYSVQCKCTSNHYTSILLIPSLQVHCNILERNHTHVPILLCQDSLAVYTADLCTAGALLMAKMQVH